MRKCGICGKLLGIGVVVHRECLENSKAEFDKINKGEILNAENSVMPENITTDKEYLDYLIAISCVNANIANEIKLCVRKANADLIAENRSLKCRVEELEGMFAYECGCNQDLVQMQDENSELKQRLAKEEFKFIIENLNKTGKEISQEHASDREFILALKARCEEYEKALIK